MGDLVNEEVLADSTSVGLPHEGAFRGVEFGQKGAVALAGSKCESVGDRLVKASNRQVDLRRGGGQC